MIAYKQVEYYRLLKDYKGHGEAHKLYEWLEGSVFTANGLIFKDNLVEYENYIVKDGEEIFILNEKEFKEKYEKMPSTLTLDYWMKREDPKKEHPEKIRIESQNGYTRLWIGEKEITQGYYAKFEHDTTYGLGFPSLTLKMHNYVYS